MGAAPAVGLAVAYGVFAGEGDTVLVGGEGLDNVGDTVAAGEAAYGLGDGERGEGAGVSC